MADPEIDTTSIARSFPIASSRSTPTRHRRITAKGFAKSDCHTCSRSHQTCDRQRPQCGNCRNREGGCGGYSMNLVWKDSSSTNAQPESVADLPQNKNASQTEATSDTPIRKFKFKQGRPKKRRLIRILSDSEACDIEDPGFKKDLKPATQDVTSSGIHSNDYEVRTSLLQSESESNDDDERLSSPASDHYAEKIGDISTQLFALPDQIFDTHSPNETSGALSRISSQPVCNSSAADYRNTLLFDWTLPPEISYNNLSHKYSGVLDMYDGDFCIIPLVADCKSNPFRCRRGSSEGSRFLLHAVLALSVHHIAASTRDPKLVTEMLLHRSSAMHLFRFAMDDFSINLALLDTILIMMHVDMTESALGAWHVHITGAYNLLELSGGIRVLNRSSRVRAQVAILVWWDLSIALIHRQLPLFPSAYLERLLEFNSVDDWCFFTLTGCPDEIIPVISRLARLAFMYEKAGLSGNVAFDRFEIISVVETMNTLSNRDQISLDDPGNNGSNSADVDTMLDRSHCFEAWRHGVVLYSLQVFSKVSQQRNAQRVRYLSRTILDHIRCIREVGEIQKQILLPLFLAGSEAALETDRSFCRNWFQHWSARTRYHLFESVGAVLESVWDFLDVQDASFHWWGNVVSGESQTPRPHYTLALELLLG